jgi:pimeloyl-ACP methyl ester carboxylesterase
VPRYAKGAISAPVLLLWGERYAMIPVENARDYLMVLGDARLTALPGIGHLPQEEAPERSLQALRAFIDTASRPPVSPALR